MIIKDTKDELKVEAEIADYNPRYSLSTQKLSRGFIDLEKQVYREIMPTGRPMKEPNLV
jgi:hypothetical protein